MRTNDEGTIFGRKTDKQCMRYCAYSLNSKEEYSVGKDHVQAIICYLVSTNEIKGLSLVIASYAIWMIYYL